jgi:tetratricopeptide (TPR) repeat protein
MLYRNGKSHSIPTGDNSIHMSSETELRSFSDAFFFAELLSMFDAHNLALDRISGYCKIPEFADLACGLSRFYSWMYDRHHRRVEENILGAPSEAAHILGISDIDRFLQNLMEPNIGAPAAKSSPDEIENFYILSSWTAIKSALTIAKDNIGGSDWKSAAVHKCSLLPDAPRTRQGWTPLDYLNARLSRCVNHASRLPFWKSKPGTGQVILRHLLNSYTGLPVSLTEKSTYIKVLCGLVAKYHILQHYSRHTSESIGPDFHERIYAVFTFIKAFAAYFPHYVEAGDLHLSNLFRCHSHLRRGVTKFYQGADHFYQRQFPQAFSMAFNEYERATEFVKSGISSSSVDPSLSDAYTHLIPIICSFYKGELYRQDCSYSNAREHYYEGARACDQLLTINPTATIPPDVVKNSQNVLKTSYARTKALANLGKNYFELGEFRRALKWLFRSLASLPELSDSKHQATIRLVKVISDTLHDDKNEPLLSKNDPLVRKHLIDIPKAIHTALLQNSETFNIYPLCSKIVNTIAIILYQMRFVSEEDVEPAQSPRLKIPLAFDWLCLAIKLDSDNAQAFHNANLFQRNWHYHFNTEGSPDIPDILKECIKKRPASVVIQSFESDRDLSPMDRWNRQISAIVLGQTKPGEKADSDILDAFFAYTDNFSRKNFELLRYLCRNRTIDGLNTDDDAVYLKTLRRWSSFTPSLPRPASLSKRGGGYFLITKVPGIDGKCQRKGIVIDPGFDFVRNLYIEGHSLQDIDAIMVTHNHIDHTADIDPCLSLIWYLTNLIEKKPIDLFLSQGVAQRYSFYLRESGLKHEIVRKLRVLAPDSEQDFSKEYGFKLTTLKTKHKELGADDCGLGLVMDFCNCLQESQFSIGYTGDTDSSVLRNDHWIQALGRCQVVIANIGTVPFPELMSLSPSEDFGPEAIRLVWNLITKILNIHYTDANLSQAQLSQLKAILWSLWFNPEDEMLTEPTDIERIMGVRHWHKIFILTCLLFGKYGSRPGLFIDYLEQVEEVKGRGIRASEKSDGQKQEYLDYLSAIKQGLAPTGEHLFLGGIIFLLEKLLEKRNLQTLVVSEFREELGSFRRLIADYINKRFGSSRQMIAHTADTDFSMRLVLEGVYQTPSVNVRCSFCKLNNDCLPQDAYHNQREIREVCVKGEDDAMYYFCPRHTPGYANQYFMEKLACYKPFEREFRY